MFPEPTDDNPHPSSAHAHPGTLHRPLKLTTDLWLSAAGSVHGGAGLKTGGDTAFHCLRLRALDLLAWASTHIQATHRL